MSEISILFRGICTHLIATHEEPDKPKFELSANGNPVDHRVVLPNSDLIDTEIDPGRCVARHVPKLAIKGDAISDDLKKIMKKHQDESGTFWDVILKDVGVEFWPMRLAVGKKHYKGLEGLPHMLNKGPCTDLRRSVREGWTRRAAAYIDFSGDVEFTVEGRDDVCAKLSLNGAPHIVFRVRNSAQPAMFELPNCTSIEITNLPEHPFCGDSDYLLHYLITTLDVRENAPVWPVITPQPKVAATYRRGAGPDVYCSSSGFP